MTRLNIALLCLLPGALAVPRLHNRHEKHHHQSGLYPTGAPIAPTAGPTAPYGYDNATSVGPTGTGTAHVIYSTVTVSPLPVSSNGAVSGGGAPGAGASSSAGGKAPVNGNAPVSDNSPVTGGSGSGTCGPATITVTSANTVTVTVGAGSAAAGSSNGAISQPATNLPISPISTGNAATYGNATSSAGPIGTGTAPSGTGSTSLPIYSGKPESSVPSSSSLPVETAAPVSAPPASTTSLSAYTAPAASSEVAPVVASSADAVSAPAASSTAVAAFYQPSKPAAPVPVKSTPPVVIPTTAASSSVAASSSSPPTSPSTGSSGKARGLAYNSASLTSQFNANTMGWAYNWAQSPSGSLPAGVEFVPMLKSDTAEFTGTWKATVDNHVSAGGKYVLAFNEPEQPSSAGGAEMLAASGGADVTRVVKGWYNWMEPHAGKVKLGSPAVTSTEHSDTAGVGLLTAFLNSCTGCTVDFITCHWYGTDFDQFKKHIGDVKAAAGGRPIWLTEFAHNDAAQAASFLKQALPWLDSSESGVARYAYQYVDTTLTSNGGLSAAGKVYNGSS